LYLGGSLISNLYPLLTQSNTFSGCIRNVLSNGYYLDMSKPLTSANSNAGQCSCTVTNLCVASTAGHAVNFVEYGFIWIIIAFVFMNVLNY